MTLTRTVRPVLAFAALPVARAEVTGTVIVPCAALVSISTCAPGALVKDASRRYAVGLRPLLDKVTVCKGLADYGGQRVRLHKIAKAYFPYLPAEVLRIEPEEVGALARQSAECPGPLTCTLHSHSNHPRSG